MIPSSGRTASRGSTSSSDRRPRLTSGSIGGVHGRIVADPEVHGRAEPSLPRPLGVRRLCREYRLPASGPRRGRGPSSASRRGATSSLAPAGSPGDRPTSSSPSPGADVPGPVEPVGLATAEHERAEARALARAARVADDREDLLSRTSASATRACAARGDGERRPAWRHALEAPRAPPRGAPRRPRTPARPARPRRPGRAAPRAPPRRSTRGMCTGSSSSESRSKAIRMSRRTRSGAPRTATRPRRARTLAVEDGGGRPDHLRRRPRDGAEALGEVVAVAAPGGGPSPPDTATIAR